jgi:hypothetical protein
MQNTQTIEHSRGLITGFQSEAAAKAAELAAEKAKLAEEAAAAVARKEALLEAVANVKFFRRKRVGKDVIADEVEHFEQVRVNGRRKDTTVLETTGISVIDGVKVQGYSLDTLLTLEIGSETDFLAEKAKIEASTGSCCE